MRHAISIQQPTTTRLLSRAKRLGPRPGQKDNYVGCGTCDSLRMVFGSTSGNRTNSFHAAGFMVHTFTPAAAQHPAPLVEFHCGRDKPPCFDNPPPHEHTAEADATDEEQSSDDEAPEEVSAAAATALAGRRRKAEHQARQAAGPAPKRKRARTSSSAKSAAAADAGGEGHIDDGLELPSDLLLKVKSGGQQRMEADDLEAREMEEEAAMEAALAGKRGARVKAAGVPRRCVRSPRLCLFCFPCAAVGALSAVDLASTSSPEHIHPRVFECVEMANSRRHTCKDCNFGCLGNRRGLFSFDGRARSKVALRYDRSFV